MQLHKLRFINSILTDQALYKALIMKSIWCVTDILLYNVGLIQICFEIGSEGWNGNNTKVMTCFVIGRNIDYSKLIYQTASKS